MLGLGKCCRGCVMVVGGQKVLYGVGKCFKGLGEVL